MQGEYRGEALPDGHVVISYHPASYTMRSLYSLAVNVMRKLEQFVSPPPEPDFTDARTDTAFSGQSGLVGAYYFPREQSATFRAPLIAEVRVSKSGEAMITGIASAYQKPAASVESVNPSLGSEQSQEADKLWERHCADGKNKTSPKLEEYCLALENWRFDAELRRQHQKLKDSK